MDLQHLGEGARFRRLAATLTIGSFSIAALMGIAALLGPGDFGEGEGRVVLTTVIVGCASMCSLCYLATSGTRWAPLGLLSGVALALPVVTGLTLVWSDWSLDADGTLRAFGVGVVLSLTLAQLCLLLSLAGDGRLGAVLWPTVLVAAVVALLVSGMVLGQDATDGLWRLVGVLAILDVLGTLVTIAWAKFADRSAPGSGVRLRVTLSEHQTVALRRLAAGTGHSPDRLVAEAVDRMLIRS